MASRADRSPTRYILALASGAASLAAILALGLVALSLADRRQSPEEARAAVEQAISEITFAQDRHDGQSFAAHFVSDGIVRITDSERPITAQGTAALRRFASGPGAGADLPFSSAPGDIHHLVTNDTIAFPDSGHAVHRAYYMSVARTRSGNGLVFVEMGNFEDNLVRRNGKWLIVEHHIRHRAAVD